MQDDSLQYLSDYVAIRQLNVTYNRYADLADGKSYSNLFTEDAEFNIVGEATGLRVAQLFINSAPCGVDSAVEVSPVL